MVKPAHGDGGAVEETGGRTASELHTGGDSIRREVGWREHEIAQRLDGWYRGQHGGAERVQGWYYPDPSSQPPEAPPRPPRAARTMADPTTWGSPLGSV